MTKTHFYREENKAKLQHSLDQQMQ